MGEADATAPFTLVGAKPRALTPKQTSFLLRSHVRLPLRPDMAASGREMKTPRGRIAVGDLAVFLDAGGRVARGFAQEFFRLQGDGTGPAAYYAHVVGCPREGGARHTAPPSGNLEGVVVDANLLLGPCPYYRKEQVIHALEADRLAVG